VSSDLINSDHVKFFTACYLAFTAVLVNFTASSKVQMVFHLFLLIAGPVFGLVIVVLSLAVLLLVWSRTSFPEKQVNMLKFITFKDAELKEYYSTRNMPMFHFVEAYLAEKLDINMDLYTLLVEHRYEIFRMCFCLENFNFLLGKLLPQAFNHSTEMDNGEIEHVYNRGNDFYGWFLGSSMVYTSGLFTSPDESLETAQKRKLDAICSKLELDRFDQNEQGKMLDLGCGWGTLACHATSNHNVTCMGISLAKEQVQFGFDQAEKLKVREKVDLRVMDYRLLPETQFDAISCVEMSEHVGVWKYADFLRLVKSRLKDDGLFFLQIAGLRRAWQFEDLIWGIFMGTYIFPAADASCPLGWVISQLEAAGFEIKSSETIGVHYGWTIKRWYNNWLQNRDLVVAKYGEWWYRLWCVFLAWSVIIANQGSSTCFQIVAHKNLSSFDRTRFIHA